MNETHKRTIIRTLSYRFAALFATAIFIGIEQATTVHIYLAVLQYVIERVWLRISWGTLSAVAEK